MTIANSANSLQQHEPHKYMKSLLGIALVIVMVGFAAPAARAVMLQAPLSTESFFFTDVSDIGRYINMLYNFAIIFGAFLALAMIVFNAIKYMVSAGNAGLQQDARAGITAALLGLALLFGVYLILFTINPNLVNLSLDLP